MVLRVDFDRVLHTLFTAFTKDFVTFITLEINGGLDVSFGLDQEWQFWGITHKGVLLPLKKIGGG